MRVIRGRRADVATDRAVTRGLRDWVAETGEPGVRVWRPPRQVAFGRRDRRADGFGRARRTATARGFPAVNRETGGRAVAHTGATVAFVRIEPVADGRTGIPDRYGRALDALTDAFADLGVAAARGEPPRTFCPGSHSLQSDGKIAGLAQRIGNGVATVGGVVVVGGREGFVDVLSPVYGALGLPLDSGAVGSLASAGADSDPDGAARAIERALVGDADASVERAADWPPPDG